MLGIDQLTTDLPGESIESPTSVRPVIACRRIRDADLEAVIALLAVGFPERDVAYWRRAMTRLRDRHVPESHPRYGYMLTDADRAVGVALLIFSQSSDGRTYANVSSWYVEPAYRGYSSALLAFVFRLRNVILFNISPTPSTIETIEAQGFKSYCSGTFHTLPAVHPPVRGAKIRPVVPSFQSNASLLARLAADGCYCFEVTFENRVYPFAFLPRRFAQDRLPGVQLVYCPDIADFVRFAGPLGRRLFRFGIFAVMMGANGPIEGLAGRYLEGRRLQFFRGETPPPLYDLSETELVLFGP